MTGFLLASALLTALVLVGVLRPIWSSHRRLALGLLIGLPLMTALLYRQMGTPEALDASNVQAPRTMDEAIAQLERRLQRQPDEAQGWLLLARSRAAQGQFAKARDAFAKAHALLPADLDVQVEYADAQLRSSSDSRFPDSARALLEQVVAANPQHQRGLFMLGLQRLQTGRAAEAVALWEQLLPQLDPETAQALRPQIDAARVEAGLPPAAAADAEPAVAADAPTPTLQVRVELADELQGRIPASAVLFVFARSIDGSNMPVAVKRLPAKGFPLELTLSDRDGLMPSQKLSMQTSVRLLAKISLGGDAGGSPGDFEAAAQQIDVRDQAQATLRIDRIRQ